MVTRVVSIFVLFALVSSLLGGCVQRGPRDFINENDRLRRENMELRETVAELRQRTADLERSLETERARGDSPLADLPASVQPPTVTRIEVGRFSGGIDTDGDGADDAVRLYLNTLDARGRFVPVVGEVRVSIVAVPPGEEARTLATVEHGPEQLQQAYRSGFAGTHYTLIAPVDEPVPEDLNTVLVRVRLTDLLTGAQHNAEATLRWSHGS